NLARRGTTIRRLLKKLEINGDVMNTETSGGACRRVKTCLSTRVSDLYSEHEDDHYEVGDEARNTDGGEPKKLRNNSGRKNKKTEQAILHEGNKTQNIGA
ncbi:hypothetical protein PIB30_110387, partial [Stylosanthes scabra]|nr:hypothetical protein [Stylosanthes scabra]